jgi:hypothetical protein
MTARTGNRSGPTMAKHGKTTARQWQDNGKTTAAGCHTTLFVLD